MSPRVIISLAAALLAGCPRPVVPEATDKVLPVIRSVEVRPGRQALVVDAGAAALGAFAGDRIVVAGTGWQAATAQLRVGARSLELLPESSDAELHALVPPDLESGTVVVAASEGASAPSAETIVYLGAGHLPLLRFAGTVEPQVEVLRAGTSDTYCILEPDGGAADAGCRLRNGPDGVIAAAYRYRGASAETYLALLEPAARARNSLPALPRNDDGGPGGTVDSVHAVYPFLVPAEYVPETDLDWTSVATHMGAAYGPYLDGLYHDGYPRPFDRLIAPTVLRRGIDEWIAIGRSGASDDDDRIFTFPLGGLDESDADTAQFPFIDVMTRVGAVGLLERGWSSASADQVLFIGCSGPRVLGRIDFDDEGTLTSASSQSLEPCDGLCAPCLAAACAGGAPFKILPLEPGTAVLIPPSEASDPGTGEPQVACSLDVENGILELVSGERSVVSAAVFPAAEGGGRVAWIPRERNDYDIARQLHTWSVADGLRTLAMPHRYLQIATSGSVLFAVRGGNRIDVFDEDLRLGSVASVLGTPETAWSAQGVSGVEDVIVYERQVLRVDAAGLVREQVFLDDAAAYQWKLIQQPLGEDPSGLWFVGAAEDGVTPAARRMAVEPGRLGATTVEARIPPTTADVAIAAVSPRWIALVVHVYDDGTLPFGATCRDFLALVDRSATTAEPRFIGESCGAVDARYVVHDRSEDSLYVTLFPFGLAIISLGDSPEATRNAALPASLAVVPGGGVLGAFYDEVGVVLGGLDARHELYAIQPLATDEVTLALSPDGSRLYLGMEEALLEYAIAPRGEDGRHALRIESRTAISGRVGPMAIDARGERLLLVRPDEDDVAIIQ